MRVIKEGFELSLLMDIDDEDYYEIPASVIVDLDIDTLAEEWASMSSLINSPVIKFIKFSDFIKEKIGKC